MSGREAITLGATFGGLCLLGVAALFTLRGRRELLRPLPTQRFRAVTWDGEVCIWAFLLLFVTQAVVALAVGSNPLRLALSAGLLFVEVPIVIRLLGGLPYRPSISWRRVRTDAAIGFITWLVVTPITLGVFLGAQYVMSRWGESPQEHTLIKLLRDEAPWWLWLLIGVEAVISAPIREELFFRGILQPWAMRRPWGGDLLFAFALVAGYAFRDAPTLASAVTPSLFVAVVLAGYLMFSGRLSSRKTPAGWYAPSRAIIGGGLLFAMFHGPVWPAPIPLTVLGIALGCLAYRTQGLIAPLVCHSLFNGLTIIQQFILIRQPQ